MRDALNTARTRRYTIGQILTGKAVRTADDIAAVAAFVAASSLSAITGATFGLFDSPVADDSCSITSGAAVLTSPNNPWTAADVGKAIDVQGAGVAGATLRAMILAYTSAGSVTLSVNASTTVAATSTSAGGLAVWGNQLTLSRNLPVRQNEAGSTESSAASGVSSSVLTYGADPTGVVDSTAAIQLAIDTSLDVYLPPGSYKISATLVPHSGSNIHGAGMDSTFLVLPAAAAFDAIRATSKVAVRVADLTITGGGLAASLNYSGITYNLCSGCTVERVKVYDTDAWGVWFLDCSYCVAINCQTSYSNARYAAFTAGYAQEMDGCDNCKFIGCHGSNVVFGFNIIANDGLGGGGNSSSSTRVRTVCTGNAFIDCTVDGFTTCAFDINACDLNTVSGCVGRNFTGATPDAPCFQVKHTNGSACVGNTIFGCVADTVGSGFYAQRGENNTWSGCVVRRANYQGFWLNHCPNAVITGCSIFGYGAAGLGAIGVKIEASANNAVVTGMVIDSDNNAGSLTAVSLAASSNCIIDGISLVNTHTSGLAIDATSGNNSFGDGARLGAWAITDLNGTTIWPIHIKSAEIALSGGGADYATDLSQRGMRICRIRLVTTLAVTGTTPKGRAGRQGSTAAYLALTNFGTTVGNVDVLPAALASTFNDPSHILFVGTDGAATTGKGIIVIEGLEVQ